MKYRNRVFAAWKPGVVTSDVLFLRPIVYLAVTGYHLILNS